MQDNAIDIMKTWAYQNLGLDSNNKFIILHVNRSILEKTGLMIMMAICTSYHIFMIM